MENYKTMYIYILIIFIFLLSVLFYCHSRNWKRKIANPIAICYILTLLSLILDMTWMFVDGKIKYKVLNYIINIIECSVVGMIGYCWFYYCLMNGKYERLKTPSVKILLFLPLVVTSTLIILSPWIKQVFYINDKGEYTRGPLFSIMYIGYLYVIASSIISFFNIKRTTLSIEKNNYKVLAYFTLPCLTLAGIQVLMAKVLLPFLEFSIYFLCFCIFIHEQNQTIRYDGLTKLVNKFEFERIANHTMKKYRKNSSKKIYILAGDFDGFKKINDYYGHNEGDDALYEVSRILDEVSLSHDALACRRSGDEFLGLLYSSTVHPDQLLKIVNEKIEKLTADKPYVISLSFGYDMYDGVKSLRELINLADRRMYANKRKNAYTKTNSSVYARVDN